MSFDTKDFPIVRKGGDPDGVVTVAMSLPQTDEMGGWTTKFQIQSSIENVASSVYGIDFLESFVGALIEIRNTLEEIKADFEFEGRPFLGFPKIASRVLTCSSIKGIESIISQAEIAVIYALENSAERM